MHLLILLLLQQKLIYMHELGYVQFQNDQERKFKMTGKGKAKNA